MASLAGERTVPLFTPAARHRLVASRIAPEAAIERPHFPYERLIGRLAEDPPRWPESTTGISEIRVALRYRPSGLRRLAGTLATVNVDFVDYPGEWLLDLPLLERSFAAWSAEALAACESGDRRLVSAGFLDFLGARTAATTPASGALAEEGARLYRDALLAARSRGFSFLQPGRFVSPGEFEGAPVLHFFPMRALESPLATLLSERFEAYKRHVVTRFYREHFRRFDRQIVLVDLVGAYEGGGERFADVRRALGAVMRSFRFGRSVPALLRPFLGARIDRALFAVTKADHALPPDYAALARLLEESVAATGEDIRFRGGTVAFRALASVRASELGAGRLRGEEMTMLAGIPVGAIAPVAVRPSPVPDGVAAALRLAPRPGLPVFRPPPLLGGSLRPLPQIGLDDALEFLIGDAFR